MYIQMNICICECDDIMFRHKEILNDEKGYLFCWEKDAEIFELVEKNCLINKLHTSN